MKNPQSESNPSSKVGTLLIGRDGFLGSALYARLKCAATTRRGTETGLFFDLTSDPKCLPDAEVVILVAANSKFRDCEISATWEVNVDAPVRIAHRYKGSFIVYISSEAAEWSRTGYGLQKQQAEVRLMTVVPYENLAIIRPSKIYPDGLQYLCDWIEGVVKNRLFGVHR